MYPYKVKSIQTYPYINGLVQYCSNSSANTLELTVLRLAIEMWRVNNVQTQISMLLHLPSTVLHLQC